MEADVDDMALHRVDSSSLWRTTLRIAETISTKMITIGLPKATTTKKKDRILVPTWARPYTSAKRTGRHLTIQSRPFRVCRKVGR